MLSEEEKKAYAKYMHEYKKEHYDSIHLLTPKGTREKWKSFASDYGMSLSQFVVSCVENEMHGKHSY